MPRNQPPGSARHRVKQTEVSAFTQKDDLDTSGHNCVYLRDRPRSVVAPATDVDIRWWSKNRTDVGQQPKDGKIGMFHDTDSKRSRPVPVPNAKTPPRTAIVVPCSLIRKNECNNTHRPASRVRHYGRVPVRRRHRRRDVVRELFQNASTPEPTKSLLDRADQPNPDIEPDRGRSDSPRPERNIRRPGS